MAISTAMSAAGQVVSYDQQKKAKRANDKAATKAKMDEDRQIQLQQSQVQEKAAGEKIANNRDVRNTTARAQVAAGESGGLLNNNAVIQDVMRQGLEANSMVGQNLGRSQQQSLEEMRGADNRFTSRINSVAAPSALGAGLSIGSDLAMGGAKIKSYNAANPKK